MDIFLTLCSIFFVFLPVLFWGYVFSYLDNRPLSANRFFIGVASGAMSVLPIVYSREILAFFGAVPIFDLIAEAQASVLIWPSFVFSFGLPIAIFLVAAAIVFFPAF